jgi:staphylococcal nuclease domain-containing protein 1
VRTVKNAKGSFHPKPGTVKSKVCKQKRVTSVIEYVFDGSCFRCLVIDPNLPEYQYSNFTLLPRASCPRLANPKVDPPTQSEPLSLEARQFVTARMLQRELKISLLGAEKSGSATTVGTIHHPAGNISVELSKNGLAWMTN